MDRRDQRKSAAAGGRVVEEEVIPVIEEGLEVEQRAREGRTVTVTTRPVTERADVSQPVTRETVEVDRVPVGKVVESLPEVREEGDLTIIPVVEERLVVRVEKVLTEEIHLRRTRSIETEEHTFELRKTEVEISE